MVSSFDAAAWSLLFSPNFFMQFLLSVSKNSNKMVSNIWGDNSKHKAARRSQKEAKQKRKK
jgi:hypothetical protein